MPRASANVARARSTSGSDGQVEVDPPHREHDQQAADDDGDEVADGASASSATCTPTVADEHRLAEHDDREEPVALGDVAAGATASGRPLGPDRHGQLGGDQDDEADDAPRAVGDEASAIQPTWHDVMPTA